MRAFLLTACNNIIIYLLPYSLNFFHFKNVFLQFVLTVLNYGLLKRNILCKLSTNRKLNNFRLTLNKNDNS